MVNEEIKVAVEAAISRMREINRVLMARLDEARVENVRLRRLLAEKGDKKDEDPNEHV